jgi:hypothetical protein
MFGKKVSVSNNLFAKLETASQILGCSSVEEFVERTLESEADRILTQATKDRVSKAEVDEITSKLKGLGYLE